jgi:hypothetical protein
MGKINDSFEGKGKAYGKLRTFTLEVSLKACRKAFLTAKALGYDKKELTESFERGFTAAKTGTA